MKNYPDKIMRILIVIPDRKVGGGQIFALRLAETLAGQHDVFVIAAKPEWQDASPPKIPKNVIEINLPHRWLIHFLKWRLLKKIFNFFDNFFLGGTLQRLRERQEEKFFNRLLVNYQIDILNTHTWWADSFVSRHLDLSLNIPWVITMHGCYEACIQNTSNYPNFRKESCEALSKACKIIFISDKNLEFFKHVNNEELRSKTLKIYNGFAKIINKKIDLTPWGVANDDFKLGIVSRAIPEKGWELAIIATQRAREETGRNIHLFLLGTSNYQKNIAKKYDWPFIHFVGYTHLSLDWILSFDVGLLPTYFSSESLPNCIVEFLSCGKPVIATSIGDIPIMIDAGGGLAGQLIGFDEDGMPDVNELKDAIINYIVDPNLLKKHSGYSKAAYAKFDMKKCITAYERVFCDCLNT